MKHCYVIILNYKKYEDTAACIRALLSSDYPHYTAIIIDNNSGNGSLAKIQEITALNDDDCSFFTASSFTESALTGWKKVVLIQNDTNAGFAGANNLVLAKISAEHNACTWLLNPDMVVERNTMSELMLEERRWPGTIVGAVTKSFSAPQGILFYGGSRVIYSFATVKEVISQADVPRLSYISGGCLLCDSAVWLKLGLLSEQFFLYWEDAEWGFRARKNGVGLRVAENAVCYDKISTTIGRGFLSDYFYTRNGLKFIAGVNTWYVLLAIPSLVPRIMKRLLKGEYQRVRGMIYGTLHFFTGGRYEDQ
ncbi:glycosyltransferase family 2 protein [Parasegetibacter sp. NRK P23]|uniref:glycosyltransferase family 2 protein n=1 Tax=Parasegetibacter sp. NRK P23 TaxID=2942999 RepID=UPI002042F6CF|nr:glycosyltransferase family 2 protein [Parasegetibacter sp. NRK P23]MCM5527512.1 glycosyltransferase family 2 protein [Parasegetibacter sp. NRK P23]